MSVKLVLCNVFDEIRERHSPKSVERYISIARRMIQKQSTGNPLTNGTECCVGNPGPCPDPRLKKLWSELKEAASDFDGDSFLSGKDLDLILEVAPQLFPGWFQEMLLQRVLERVECPHCNGKGYTMEKRTR